MNRIDYLIASEGSCISIDGSGFNCMTCIMNPLCSSVMSEGLTNEDVYKLACKVRDNNYIIDESIIFDLLL